MTTQTKAIINGHFRNDRTMSTAEIEAIVKDVFASHQSAAVRPQYPMDDHRRRSLDYPRVLLRDPAHADDDAENGA